MTRRRSQIWMAAGAAVAALATGGMTLNQPGHPVRMANLKATNLGGYEVRDNSGARVGQIASIDADARGRARWLNIALDEGGVARVASFRADLDAERRLVSVRLPEDLLAARVSSPSA